MFMGDIEMKHCNSTSNEHKQELRKVWLKHRMIDKIYVDKGDATKKMI